MSFSEQIKTLAKKNSSSVVAGLDPSLTSIPQPYIQKSKKKKGTADDFIAALLTDFYCDAIDSLFKDICAIKPNSAFFEQYGIGGMEALQEILLYCKKKKIPSILDAKRGDIGSTAAAYAAAVFSTVAFQGKKITGFPADALTINPFLGFDTLQPFVEAVKKEKKHLFVLLATSNPGASDIQEHASDKVVRWILKQQEAGVKEIGVVVGATYPEKLINFRTVLPSSLFLIPGVGTQGATPTDVATAYTGINEGALINSSRGIFTFSKDDNSITKCLDRIKSNAQILKAALNYAQQQPRLNQISNNAIANDFDAETMLLDAFELLKNKKKLNPIKNKQVGDYWQPSWIKAPFEECLTFKQITDIGFENIIKKRSMNPDKMVALTKAIRAACRN